MAFGPSQAALRDGVTRSQQAHQAPGRARAGGLDDGRQVARRVEDERRLPRGARRRQGGEGRLLAAAQALERVRRRRHGRIAGEGLADRQHGQRGGGRERQERIDRRRVLDAKGADARPAQALQVGAGLERPPYVGRQHAHVRPFRAGDAELDPVGCAQHQLETLDRDLARRALDLEAAARELVERHAVTLERRVHGRHLLLAPGEARGDRIERGLRERRDGRRVDRRAGAVERVGRGAEADRALVRLLLDEEVARHLGRLAEAEREEAARERVERTQVPDLGPPEPRLERTDYAGRGRPLRLVDQEDAGHSASPSLAARSRSSTRRAVSGWVSYSKRSSGVTRSPSARPTRPLRKVAARASARSAAARASTASPSVRTYTRATRRSADMRTAVTVRSRSRGSFASRRKTVASSAGTRCAPRSARRSAIAPGSESVNESPDRAGRPRRPQRKAPPNRYRRGIAGRYGEEEQRRAAGCIGRSGDGSGIHLQTLSSGGTRDAPRPPGRARARR